MSASFALSRPALCAGRLPLYLLINKLVRIGEDAVVESLVNLPLEFQRRRVWWLMSGTSLTVEVA